MSEVKYSAEQIKAASQRLLFSCGECEKEGSQRSYVLHTGLPALQQHFRTVHAGIPVNFGSTQVEPQFLFRCSACKRIFSSFKSLANHRTKSKDKCQDATPEKVENPHRHEGPYDIPAPPLSNTNQHVLKRKFEEEKAAKD